MSVSLSSDNKPMDVHAGASVSWPFNLQCEGDKATITFDIVMGPNPEEAPEWFVSLSDANGELWDNYRTKSEVKVDIPGAESKELFLEIICPGGARYGDTVTVSVIATSDGVEDTLTFNARATQSLMILKTQIGQERSVIDSLLAKSEDGEKDIYAMLSPNNLRGYLFVEGMNTERMREKTRDIRKARSFIDGESSMDEISPYLTPLSTVVGIVEGDLVELIDGPFKGEKARVQQIDQSKEEITVELIEAMVPIPVTVKGDSVRVIEKEK